eukprot:scaffold80_cov325-Pavlova_lutheri.AAC.9
MRPAAVPHGSARGHSDDSHLHDIALIQASLNRLTSDDAILHISSAWAVMSISGGALSCKISMSAMAKNPVALWQRHAKSHVRLQIKPGASSSGLVWGGTGGGGGQ